MIGREMLLQVAKKKGLKNREHIEKDYFQDLFLFHLYRETNLLVFKGGTALYKIYNLPRFSEDLDFSVLKETGVEALINRVADRINAEVRGVKRMKSSMTIKLGLKGILTSQNTLRIDVNTKNVVFGYEVKHYVSDYIDINPFSLRLLELKEIVAEKVHSILQREKSRDLYDLFFLLRFVEPERKTIEKKLAVFSMAFDFEEFKKRVEGMKKAWQKELAPFVLTELTDFDIVKGFVLAKLAGAFKAQ